MFETLQKILGLDYSIFKAKALVQTTPMPTVKVGGIRILPPKFWGENSNIV